MKKIIYAAMAFSLIAVIGLSKAQTINGIPSQSMSGFAAGVNGAPIIATANNYLGNSGTITSQVECTTTVCPAGEYVALISVSPTTTASLGSLSLTLSFTDTAQAQTITAISGLLLTSKAPASTVYPFWSTGGANITWSTTVSGVTGSYVYDVRVRLIKLS